MLLNPRPPEPQKARRRDHTIVRQLWTSALLMTLCTLMLSAVVLFYFYERYERSRRNVEDIEYFRVVLDAATALAAERGPANSAMGESLPGLSAQMEWLVQARQKTDAGLLAIRNPPDGEKDHAIPEGLLSSLEDQVAKARRQVDSAIAKAPEARTYDDIQSAIEDMISASNMMDDCLRWLSGSLIAEDPDLATPVIGGQILSELRDYTGRIASHVIAPIVVRQTMPLKNQIESRITRGRVVELLRLLDLSIAAYPNDRAILDKKTIFEQLFFRQGLRIVDRAIEEGSGAARYSQTAAELSRDYVPTIRPVEEVRSAFLSAAISELYHKEKQARYMLIAVLSGTLIVTVFLIGIAASVQIFLFGPLLHAGSMVIDLAEGKPPTPPARPWRGAEMRRLQDSLVILGERMREWSALVSRLKTEADTDGMTGLLNRAAFERLVRSHQALNGTCLILIDIDHFKSINDRFGHPAGDNVIRQIGDLLRRELGNDHAAARFGGEEFAILHREELAASAALCERLREGISLMPVPYDGAILPPVTASFGIASHRNDSFEDLVRRADAALYRAKGDGRNRVCIGV